MFLVDDYIINLFEKTSNDCFPQRISNMGPEKVTVTTSPKKAETDSFFALEIARLREANFFFTKADLKYNTAKMPMKGLTWSSLKKAPSLIPLFVILGLGVSAAIFYPLRCALKSPDVSWNKKKNPEPWNEYIDKQYKFYQTPRLDEAVKVTPPKY